MKIGKTKIVIGVIILGFIIFLGYSYEKSNNAYDNVKTAKKVSYEGPQILSNDGNNAVLLNAETLISINDNIIDVTKNLENKKINSSNANDYIQNEEQKTTEMEYEIIADNKDLTGIYKSFGENYLSQLEVSNNDIQSLVSTDSLNSTNEILGELKTENNIVNGLIKDLLGSSYSKDASKLETWKTYEKAQNKI